jgi:predicted metal-dependent hydrolase
MKINNNLHIQNPVLHYKLDPGEPGLATPSRASQSIARVATHEATNIRRFRREAMEQGGVVVYSFISLHMEKRGAFFAATSGKSSAIVIIPAEEEKKSLNVTVKKNDDNNSFNKVNERNKLGINEKNKDDNNKISSASNNTIVDDIEQINSVIDKLETEKAALEGQLTDNKSVIIIKKNEDKNTYKEDRLDEIEKKIHYLEQKKELEKQKRFLSNLSSTKNLSLKLAGLIYNNSNLNIDGSLFDETI